MPRRRGLKNRIPLSLYFIFIFSAPPKIKRVSHEKCATLKNLLKKTDFYLKSPKKLFLPAQCA